MKRIIWLALLALGLAGCGGPTTIPAQTAPLSRRFLKTSIEPPPDYRPAENEKPSGKG